MRTREIEGAAGTASAVSWVRMYELALRALPAALRRRHGRAMEALFARELERAGRSGPLRRALAGAAGVWDVLRRGLYERWRGRTTGRGVRVGRHLEDLRHGIRSLRRSAAFTATAVTVLALGIGTATAVWAAFRAVVLEELPLSDPDRVVAFSLQGPSSATLSFTSEEITALRRESRTLQDVAGVAGFGAEAIPTTEGGRPLVLSMSRVTANFFDVLGAGPVLGRLLRPSDGADGAPLVAVISYRTWRRAFGGDPAVVGRQVTQTRYQESYAIVGVAPPGLGYPVGADYWIAAGPRDPVHAVARLAGEATPETARDELLSLARILDGRRSEPRSPAAATVQPLSEAVLGDAKPALLAITAAVALLLLMACVNVGNLFLMRAAQRSSEVMVRRALGAGSGGVARLFLMEGALLGAAGGGLGLALAVGLLHVLPTLAPAALPRTEMIGLSGAPVAVALALTTLVVLLSCVGPALSATRPDVASALRIDGRSGTGTKGRLRLRRSLVGAQVALAVVLLFGAGLLARSLDLLTRIDLGYDARNVAIVELGLNREGREGAAETFGLLEGVMERMRGVPGVTGATPLMFRPFAGETGIFAARPMAEGQSESEAASNPRVPLEVGGGELFRTLGVPILRGRGLLETDRDGAPNVAVVSRSLAERLWPDADPVGKRIRLVTSEASWWTVVGVAGDTRFRRLREPTPTIYLPFRQLHIIPGVWTVAVRTADGLAPVLPAMRRAVHDLDPRVHVWRVGTLEEHLARGPLAQPRMSAFLLAGFGLAALLLAAIGLYGVMALAVRERTHELGVRRALGASANRLRGDVLVDALTVTGAGLIAGLGAALVASRLLGALLFGVGPTDPVTVVGVSATLLAMAALAAYLPARRAIRVDPLRALGHG